MGKVISIKKRTKSRRGTIKRLEQIKKELIRSYGIDLDQLMASEPASNLTIDEFEEFTERLLSAIDDFCDEHTDATIHDVLYTLENVRDIIRDSIDIDGD